MLRTPGRTPNAHGTPSTPAPPPGLVVSKLGVQATASAGVARGLLCLKITLPRSDGTPQRWALFSSTAPELRSIPALYPLPASALRGANLTTAAVLLHLPTAGSYPPPPSEPVQQRPFIDVSATTGQVYVVVEPSPGRPRGRRESVGTPGTPAAPGAAAAKERTEWLVVIEFEVEVESTELGTDQLFKASLPVPKCLDNVVRFHIVPEDEANSDVSIATEPKVLPLPPSHFSQPRRDPAPSTPSRRPRIEDGWADGEVPGADETSDEEEEGSWLEGRFQSTDTLTLEWGFVPSVGAPPDLRVTPEWDNVRPRIKVTFDATLPVSQGPLSLEAILPEGWGWSELEIRGDSLVFWRSADESLRSRRAPTADDSASTTMGHDAFGSPTRIKGLATLDAADDFSFELSSFNGVRPSNSTTPSRRRSITAERAPAALHKVTPRVATAAAFFELEFSPASDDDLLTEDDEDDDDEDNRVILIEGTLVPLPLTLVSPDAPVSIPFIRFDDPSLPTQSAIVCPNATFQDSPTPEDPTSPTLCTTSALFVGTFAWTGGDGERIQPRPTVPLTGPVRVVVQRNIWGVQTVAVGFEWPVRAAEIALVLPVSTVRVVQATCRSKPLPRAVLPRDAGAEVRIAGGRGSVELVLEAADDKGVALPSFPGATGDLQVELAGDGWEKLLDEEPATSLKRVSDRGFSGDLGTSATITFATPKSGKVRTSRKLVSWSMLINLLLIWILVSLAQQVQRLRAEVAFIADETSDLRTYGHVLNERLGEERRHRQESHPRWDTTEVPDMSVHADEQHHPGSKSDTRPHEDQQQRVGSNANVETAMPNGDAAHPHGTLHRPKGELEEVHRESHGLGRVVLQSGWTAWTAHPALQTLVSTMSYVWRTVMWILLPQ